MKPRKFKEMFIDDGLYYNCNWNFNILKSAKGTIYSLHAHIPKDHPDNAFASDYELKVWDMTVTYVSKHRLLSILSDAQNEMVNFLRAFEYLEYTITPELESNLVEVLEGKGTDETKQNYIYFKKRATTLPPET